MAFFEVELILKGEWKPGYMKLNHGKQEKLRVPDNWYNDHKKGHND